MHHVRSNLSATKAAALCSSSFIRHVRRSKLAAARQSRGPWLSGVLCCHTRSFIEGRPTDSREWLLRLFKTPPGPLNSPVTSKVTSRAYTTRAKAYSKLGKYELAYADLNEALRLDPSFFFYLHPSSTDSYAAFVADSSLASTDGIRWLGLIGILALLFVLIFRFTLPAPHKSDDN